MYPGYSGHQYSRNKTLALYLGDNINPFVTGWSRTELEPTQWKYIMTLSLADTQPADTSFRDYAMSLRVPGGNTMTATLEENRKLAKMRRSKIKVGENHGWKVKGEIASTLLMVPDSISGKI